MSIHVNTGKTHEVAEETASLLANLANTAGVFEEIVKPQADISGSAKFQAASRDVASIKEDFEAKAGTARKVADGMEDYLNNLKKINSL